MTTSTQRSDNLLLVLKRVQLAIRRAFDEELASHGVTGPQAEILRHVSRQDGLEQRTLQERLGVTSATLSGILDGLVERELIERRLSPEDARVKQLFLTPGGTAVSERLCAAVGAVEARLLYGFSPAEQALLQDWLRRLAHNLGAIGLDQC
jgi:MarR family transcriptional regulator for hemolysin